MKIHDASDGDDRASGLQVKRVAFSVRILTSL